MDEIHVLMTQFQVAIKLAIEAEVKRQIGAQISSIASEDMPVVRARKPYAKSMPKPCPKCGTLNMARRYRFHCQEHRS